LWDNMAILGEKQPSGQAGTHSPGVDQPSSENTLGIFPNRTAFLFRLQCVTAAIRTME